LNNEVSKIEGNKITFKHFGKITKGLILSEWHKRFNAKVFFVAVGNVIYIIHETLNSGIVTDTNIFSYVTDLTETAIKAQLTENGYEKVISINA
jgi:hypothetical protein